MSDTPNPTSLADDLRKACLLEGDFVLRSGQRSRYYFDKYRFETDPALLEPVAAALAERIAELLPDGFDRLAGAELGGVPLVTAVSLKLGRPTILVRNQKKDYGTSKPFEGTLEEGETIVLLEDVATTGGQILEAARVLEAAGGKVLLILATLDRLSSARTNIESAGYRFESLLTAHDIGMPVA